MTAKKIKQIRKALGWSQAEFAENLGVNQSTVSHWEQGLRNPTGPAERLIQQLSGKIKKKSNRVLHSK